MSASPMSEGEINALERQAAQWTQLRLIATIRQLQERVKELEGQKAAPPMRAAGLPPR